MINVKMFTYLIYCIMMLLNIKRKTRSLKESVIINSVSYLYVYNINPVKLLINILYNV